VEIHGRSVRGASVGDSGAWLVGPPGLADLTDSQRSKPLLGSGTCRPTAFGPVDLDRRLIVASDGLFKYAPRERIRQSALAGPVELAVQALLDAVRLPRGGFQDDVAVVLAESTS
jgi:PPM family protein phosphatase